VGRGAGGIGGSSTGAIAADLTSAGSSRIRQSEKGIGGSCRLGPPRARVGVMKLGNAAFEDVADRWPPPQQGRGALELARDQMGAAWWRRVLA
jgi:hypothetical protein